MVKSQFLDDISEKVLFDNIPNKLTINTDQTPDKFTATDKTYFPQWFQWQEIYNIDIFRITW